jgi:PAS domain S-box-containing protein
VELQRAESGLSTREAPNSTVAQDDARVSALRLLTQAMRGIDPDQSLEELLQTLSDAARELTGARRSAIRLTDDGPGAASATSPSHERAERRHHRAGDGRGLATPLVAGDGVSVGVLELSGKPGGDFTREDEELAFQLAQVAALAIQRQRADAARRASDERFRSLFEDAVIGMALIDSHGCFAECNPAFCRLLGRSDDELRGLSWLDLVHPRDREMAAATRAQQLAGAGDSGALETRFMHKGGQPVWARVMGASVGGPDGEPARTLVQAVDITEQRRLEEATSRLYALTRDLFCTVGFDGRFKSANPAWGRTLGYSSAELLSRPFIEFVHERDRGRTRREFERLREAGVLALNFENRYLHKDGSCRWLLWSAYASLEDELVYAVAKDVSDRKRSEQRLRESERKYRDLVETSSDLIWSVDSGARFTFVNRAARRIYGYEPEELLGRRITDLESDDEDRHDGDVFRRVMAGAPLFNYETRHIRKDGRPVDLTVNAIPLQDEHGRVLGASGIATDVTDRRRFEARQAAVAELGRRALEGVGLDEVTKAAAALVSGKLGVEYSGVLELLPGGNDLRLQAGVGWPPHAVGSVFPASAAAAQAACAIEIDGPVIVEDFTDEHRFEHGAWLDARSGVCVTIGGEDGPFGALCAHSAKARSYSADEVSFLQAVANVLTTAIGRKQTEQRIAQLATARGRLVAQTLAAEDRARRSISEILHDHALQDLLASRQDLVEVIEDPAGDPERVVRAREGIERAVQLLREAVFNLHPVVLDHAGLRSAIKAVADHQARRGGFECVVHVDEEATGAHDELILSLARELLTNVAKHAQASEVSVEVRRAGAWVELLVQDDGRGIPPGRREQALYEGHVGLASSSERVEALAGSFEVDSGPGRGTRARALLPARRVGGPGPD